MNRMMRTIGVMTLLLAVGGGLAGCGDDCANSCSPPVFDLSMVLPVDMGTVPDLSITTAGLVMVGPGGQNVFAPSPVTIQAGQSVTWSWVTGTHSIVSDSQPKAWVDSPTQSTGQFVVAFPTAGTYPYHCGVHGAMMSGSIIVQ
jgi:plastocyanin